MEKFLEKIYIALGTILAAIIAVICVPIFLIIASLRGEKPFGGLF